MAQPTFIDARGPRFSAAITTIVLIVALLTRSTLLTIWQLLVFAISAFYSMPNSPYGFVYRRVIAPYLNKRKNFSGQVPTEDSRPPRFAQQMGFGFVLLATVGALSHTWLLFTVATAACIFAAFLNSAFNYCLGCAIYLQGIRIFR